MVSLVGAVVVSALLLGVLGFGYGTIPALGPALDPGRGAWTSASGGQPVSSERLHVPGLTGPVTVSFSAQGLASISAGSTHDLFLALGYVHAKFRLTELDAERRLGEGRLAQLAGPSDLASDEFELRLGLLRTAQNEWAQHHGHRPRRAARLRPGRERRHRPGPRLRRLAGALHAHRPVPARRGPRSTAWSSRACSPRSSTTRRARSTTRSCTSPSARRTPPTGSPCWRRTRRRPMTRAPTSRRR